MRYYSIVGKIFRIIIKYSLLVIILFIIGRFFIFAIFNISSNSMSPLITKGDKVIVLKILYGPRLVNLYDLIAHDSISFYKLPGISSIKRNDIVVFNFPYKKWNKWDKIELQYNKYYVKRCIGLPGDTLSIKDCKYMIKDCDEFVGDCYSQNYFNNYRNTSNLLDTIIPYSLHLTRKWTVFNMGPYYIPQKDKSIKIDSKNALIYKNIIEWETEKRLSLHKEEVLLGNKIITEYKFKYNYYFMAGDNVSRSIDSRFWGLVPETFIHGKAWISFGLSGSSSKNLKLL